MPQTVDIEVLKPAQLGEAEQAAWMKIRAASSRHDSPYCEIRYVMAAGAAAPDAMIAVLRRKGRIIGFFPAQKRGAALLPLGAPMTDFHGPMIAPGEMVDLREVLDALGARSYRFSGLVGDPAPGFRALHEHRTMVADLSCGFDAWLAFRQERHPRYFKSRRRNQRALEREVGPLEFRWSRHEPELLDYVIELKRAQLHRTRQHDIFACGWTEQLLRALAEESAPDFGLGFATLRAGGKLVSAEIGLLSGGVYHLWQPVYDPAYAKYGPGNLMTLKTLEALAAEGVMRIDFGRDDAEYKSYLADPAEIVLEGVVNAGDAPLARLADRALAAGPLESLRLRARRRFHIITACETSRMAWTFGAALAVGLMLQGLNPTPRATLSSTPRRPDAQRTYSRLDAQPESRVSAKADDVLAPAA
jgi:CelD/BcsL family acetyltransferase involved in cellulose biosynthesis